MIAHFSSSSNPHYPILNVVQKLKEEAPILLKKKDTAEISKLASELNRALHDLHKSERRILQRLTRYPIVDDSTDTKVNRKIAEISKSHIEGLESQENVCQAITDLEKIREQIPPGIQNGLKIIQLQKKLQNPSLGEGEKHRICEQIVSIFSNLESAEHYEQMLLLRESLDSSSTGTSPLFQLVYQDVDVASCHRIIHSINQSASNAYAANPSQIRFRNRIYTDIDDTLKPSLNDRAVHIDGFYPSALEFYRQLGHANSPVENHDKSCSAPIEMTILSARPDYFRNLSNNHMRQVLPADTKFQSLYGSSTAFIEGVKHYIIKALIDLVSILPLGPLKTWLLEILDSSELNTFLTFAMEKRRNIDRDLLLRPETRGIMVGDTGEGDLLFLLLKNSNAAALPDERIPLSYQGKWTGEPNEPGNPTGKRLQLSFAHAISSRDQYYITPDPALRKDYSEFMHTEIIDNYVDAALYCLNTHALSQLQADIVVDESRKWLKTQETTIKKIPSLEKLLAMSEKDFAHASKELSPEDKYRIKLMRSVEKYEVARKNLTETS